MKNSNIKVVVCSRSFSKNKQLRDKLLSRFPCSRFNETGETFSGNALFEFIGDADVVIIGLEAITTECLQACSHLQFVCKMGTGTDKVDHTALSDRGVSFFHTPSFNKTAVAELSLFHMLSLVRKVNVNIDSVKGRVWKQTIGSQLSGKKVGLLGFGVIGQELARLLSTFDCKVSAYDLDRDTIDQHASVEYSTPTMLFSQSDIISIHVPLTTQTRGYVNGELIQMIKPGGILINTARGEVVDQDVLERRLINGEIYAGLDVLHQEPNVNFDLAQLPNVIVTPHIGGSTNEAITTNANCIMDYLCSVVLTPVI